AGGMKKDELPKSYDDFADRRWRGKLGVEAEDSDWFGGVVSALGEEKGLALFRKIVAANGLSVRKGHTLLVNLVVSGEVPFVLSAYAYKAEQLHKSGAPIDWLIIPPGVARFEGVAVARPAAHPPPPILSFQSILTDPPARRDSLLRVHAHGRAGHLARSRLLPGAGECKIVAAGCRLALSRPCKSAR